MLAIAAVSFAVIALDVATGGPLSALDRALSDGLRRAAGAAVIRAMHAVSALHSPRAILSAAIVVVLVLLWRRECRASATFAVAVGGGMALNAVLKHLFERPRPDLGRAATGVADFGFPSGHVANATVLYGAIALLVLPRLRTRAARVGVASATVVALLLVAGSRVLLGAHYPTDTIAAIAEGVVWLALVCRFAGDCR